MNPVATPSLIARLWGCLRFGFTSSQLNRKRLVALVGAFAWTATSLAASAAGGLGRLRSSGTGAVSADARTVVPGIAAERTVANSSGAASGHDAGRDDPRAGRLGVPAAGRVAERDEAWFPPGGRTGVFQKVKFTGAYLPRFSDDSLGMTDLELDVVFGLPFLTVETPLLVTPFYAVHFMDGPDLPDVPPRLHDAAITFQNIRPINDRWLAMFDVTVGQYADDSSFDSSEAFRITGGGAGIYRSSDQLKWVLGATYVDRINTTVLPIAGIIYTPNDDAEYRLVFPAPKLSWRLPWTDVPGRR